MMLPNSSLSRGQRYRAGVRLLGCVLALGACKKGGEGEAKGKDGKDSYFVDADRRVINPIGAHNSPPAGCVMHGGPIKSASLSGRTRLSAGITPPWQAISAWLEDRRLARSPQEPPSFPAGCW